MIKNYTRPQLFIRQVLDILNDPADKRLNAFVIGPQYFLKRYTNEDEKSTIEGHDFTTSAQTLNYEGLESGYVVDTDFVKVYAEDLLVSLATLSDNVDTDIFDISLDATRSKLIVSGSQQKKNFYGNDIHDDLKGRPVTVGDIVTVTTSDGSFTRTVASVDSTTQITLNGAVPGTNPATSVKFSIKYSGEIAKVNGASGNNYTAGPDYVSAAENIQVKIPGRSVSNEWIIPETGNGKLYVSYRALVPASSTEGYIKISSSTDISDRFGKIDPDNTLAYGAYVALQGAQGEYIYAARVESDDAAGYSAVLRKAENSDVLYAFCPLTYDTTIQNLVRNHVEDMSTDARKQWRRAYLATKSPGEYAAITSDGDPADLDGTVATLGDNKIVTLTDPTDANFIASGIKAGDLVRISGADYTVVNVLSASELEISGVIADGSVTFQVWKPATGESQAQYVANRSEELASRRAVNVWVDTPMATIDGNLVEQEVYFVAAEIAGLRSVLLPQQGLTRTELNTVESAPLMYTMYTQDELDIAAASGTFIVTQDIEDGPVYVRHQLTTKTDSGSLYYEDSIGVNFDNISYLIKDEYEPIVGKENATPDALRKIRTRIQDVLLSQTKITPGLDISPAIISIVEGFPTVTLDPVRKDTIRVAAKVELPLPINSIVVDLFATITNN